MKKWLRLVLFGLFVVVAAVWWQSARTQPRPPWPVLAGERPLVVASRGGAGRWPENTLLAFQHASNNGFAIQVDVRRSADGQLVAIHDAALERTTDGQGPVAGRSLEELRQLDAAHHFTLDDGQSYPFRGLSVRIPDLSAVLRSFPRDRIFLHLREPGLEEKAWDVLEQTGATDRVVIFADDDAVMQAFREIAKGRVPTAASSAETDRLASLARWRLTRFYTAPFDVLVLPSTALAGGEVAMGVLDWAQRNGVRVYAADMADASLVPALAELGVDAIFSERPDLILEALQKLGN